MSEHADDDQVMVGYESSLNISFKGEGEELGYTWGQWRKMSEKARVDALTDYLWTLVDVYVENQ
jgi:hypothetical protein